MSLHTKCPISPAKDDEEAESYLLYSSDWMNPQSTMEDKMCDRFCLTLGGDFLLWYESTTPVGIDVK